MTEPVSRTALFLCRIRGSAPIAVVLSAIVFAASAGCGGEDADTTVLRGAYNVQALQQFRSEKNDYLRRGDDSPIPKAERPAFAGLQYFPPDSALIVPATFKPFDAPDTVSIMMSSGDPVAMLRAGTFRFEIDGESVSLTAYQDLEHPQRLFLPFRDATNGKRTYWAGRYLDVPRKDGGAYVLDFNYAYSPYCAYNHAYACPVVPLENFLSVEIRAGEKISGEYDDKQNR